MTDESNERATSGPTGNDSGDIWRNQPTTSFRLSPTAIADAEHAHARVRRGVLAKSFAMLSGMALALYKMATVDEIFLRLAALGFVVLYGYVLFNLLRTRSGDATASDAERDGVGLLAPSLVHYRAALVRERDRLSGRRLWVPFAMAIPVALVVMFVLARAHPVLQRYLWIELTIFAVSMPLALWYGRRQGRQFQQRIDDLDRFIRD